MMTGYTMPIAAGKVTTLKDFAATCVRAFGAAIHMRDDDNDLEYRKRTPSEYHTENLTRLRAELKKIKGLSDSKIIDLKTEELVKQIKYHKDALHTEAVEQERISEMLQQINLWSPPDGDYEEFKKFMINQCSISGHDEWSKSYHSNAINQAETELKNLEAAKVRTEMIAKINKDIAYHTKQHNEDVERCNSANKWVEDLMNSFNS